MGGNLDENLAFLEEGSDLVSSVVILNEAYGIVTGFDRKLVLENAFVI